MKLEIKRGKYSDYKEQVDKLMFKHWKEASTPGAPDLRLDLDLDLYKYLEEANKHLGLVITAENNLIGYLSIMIYNHHQHKSTVFAQTDGFFVDPSYRGLRTFKAVIEMFELAQDILRSEYGVEYIYMNCNAENDLKFLADSLRFVPASTMYIKRLS